MSENIEVVFSYRSRSPTEIPSLIAYGNELIMCINSLKRIRDEARVYSSVDGYEWETKLIGVMNFWAYQFFDNKLYVGASSVSGDKTFVFEYDGSEFKKVLELSPGGGGGGGLIESLGVFKDFLYAGRRNEILRTSDGEKWEKVFEFSSNKSLYQFIEYDSKFYVFEGEPIRAPSRIYYSSDGDKWREYRVYGHVEWFRSHSPSDRVILDYPYIADGRGNVYFFDGKLNKIFERRQFRQPHNVAIRLKTFEDRLFIVYGAGTCAPARGEVWVWDNYQLGRLIQLPYGIYDVEVYGDSIYLACNNWSGLGGFCESLIVKIPASMKLETPPLAYSLTSKGVPIENASFEDELETDPIPALGYSQATLYLLLAGSADLEVEVLSLNGSWKTVDKASIPDGRVARSKVECCGRLVRFRLIPKERIEVKLAEVYLT